MYRLLIKPIILWFSTDQVRRIVLIWLYIVGKVSIIRRIVRAIYRSDYPHLEREVFGVKFSNPIGLAAGFDHNGDVIDGLESIGLGFVEIGTITAETQRANPSPNHFALPKDRAMIYRTGHPNRGWRYAINNLRRRSGGMVVGCSISRNSNTSYRDAGREILKSFRNLYQYTDYFTVVVNFDQIAIGVDSTLSEELTKILTPLIEFRRGQTEYRPIMLKITPDLSLDQLDNIITVLINSPLDGIVAVAGTESRDGLITSEKSLDSIGTGRMSGDPLFDRAVEVIRYVHKESGGAYPIIGVGGVNSAERAEQMIDAGATLVQIYTAFLYEGPSLVRRICRDLQHREEHRLQQLRKESEQRRIEEDIRNRESIQ